MGARIGEMIYYIVEAGFYGWLAYMLLIKSDEFMDRIFKKNSRKLTYFSYTMGVIAIFKIIESVYNVFNA